MPRTHHHLRTGLALTRLGLLAVSLYLLTAMGAAVAGPLVAAGWGLNRALPATTQPAMNIPRLGVTVALDRQDPQARRAALARLRDHGFGWVRQRFDWGAIEPIPGQRDWHSADALVADLYASGLTPVAWLDGSPAWARTERDAANSLAPPASPEDFVEFARSFAARYGDRVRVYQVWDEPNVAPHWGQRLIEPVHYAQLLAATAQAIRQVDHGAVIVAAALAPTQDRGHTAIDEVYFLQRMYAAGLAGQVDAVAVQSFGFGYAPADGRQQRSVLNLQRAAWVRRAMLAAGDGGTPVWLMRYGWNVRPDSPWGAVTPADQAHFAAQAVKLADADWPWLATLGWTIDRPDAPDSDPLWGYALTPALLNALRRWPLADKASSAAVNVPPLLGFACLALAGAWRAAAAARLAPWSSWVQTLAVQPAWRRWLALAAVLGLYTFATWPPLIVLCWLGVALLIAAAPLEGLLMAALLLPFHFQHKELALFGALWQAPPAQAALLCMLPALWQAWRWNNVRFRRVDWLPVTWLAVGLLSAVAVWHWPDYLRGLVDLVLAPVALYLGVRLLAGTEAARRRVLYALLAGGLLAAGVGMLRWAVGSGTGVDGMLRLVGPHFSPNHTALYLERTLFLGLGMLLGLRTQRWPLAAMVLFLLAALVLTGSRGALFLALPAGAVILVAQGMGRHRATVIRPRIEPLRAGALLLIILLTVIGGLALSGAEDRLANSTTITSRFVTWLASGHLWLDYWLTGVGPGGYFWRYPAYLPLDWSLDVNLRHPHNVWLEYATMGGGGALLWLAAAVWVVLRTLRGIVRRSAPTIAWCAVGLAAALAAGLAHGQVDAFGALADLAGWNWLALALLVGWDAQRPPHE